MNSALRAASVRICFLKRLSPLFTIWQRKVDILKGILKECNEQEKGGGESGAEFLQGKVQVILHGFLLDVQN